MTWNDEKLFLSAKIKLCSRQISKNEVLFRSNCSNFSIHNWWIRNFWLLPRKLSAFFSHTKCLFRVCASRIFAHKKAIIFGINCFFKFILHIWIIHHFLWQIYEFPFGVSIFDRILWEPRFPRIFYASFIPFNPMWNISSSWIKTFGFDDCCSFSIFVCNIPISCQQKWESHSQWVSLWFNSYIAQMLKRKICWQNVTNSVKFIALNPCLRKYIYWLE